VQLLAVRRADSDATPHDQQGGGGSHDGGDAQAAAGCGAN
jgi:hypothetical protein